MHIMQNECTNSVRGTDIIMNSYSPTIKPGKLPSWFSDFYINKLPMWYMRGLKCCNHQDSNPHYGDSPINAGVHF